MKQQIEVKQRLLAENERAASELRGAFARNKMLVLNLISSPGSGKTTLLEATVAALAQTLRIGAVSGDIATERDADRLRKLGIPASQIITGGACHLDARLVSNHLSTGTWTRLMCSSSRMSVTWCVPRPMIWGKTSR